MTIPLLQFMHFARAQLSARAARAAASQRRPASAQAQAAQVRAMADALAWRDPRFAQELYAIAYRHELLASGAQGA